MKDNFSAQAHEYAKFRPVYPRELYVFLLDNTERKNTAWDCATGNGQVAVELSKHFKKVYATDISEKQISNAPHVENIIYAIEPAEKTSFPDDFFDLITVAQAIHWFNFDLFYKEVRRTIKKNGFFAAISYGLCKTYDETDNILLNFYENITGPFWDPERKFIDERYKTIPFPFSEIETPELKHEVNWSFEQFIGFLETWSSVQHFKNKMKMNPIDIIYNEAKASWGNQSQKKFVFPVFFRAALIDK
jgi:ubiquinone/menaquinone biosynthesis C-methylase UbiE